MSDPETFMRETIRLSAEMMRQGKGGPFGALVVRDGQIIGRGCNQVTSTNDPTAHAEIVAIREACSRVGSFTLPGCQLYASCEPCPMCLSAAYWARIEVVYYGARRSDAAEAGFLDEMLYEELARPPETRKLPSTGLLRDEAVKVLHEWKAKPNKIPY
jgi:guanine deaminase